MDKGGTSIQTDLKVTPLEIREVNGVPGLKNVTRAYEVNGNELTARIYIGESFQTIEQLRFIANLALENHRASLAGTETAYSKWEGEKHVLVRELVTTSKREIAVSALAGACRAKGRVILIDIEWPKRNNAATEEALKLMVSASKSLNFEQ